MGLVPPFQDPEMAIEPTRGFLSKSGELPNGCPEVFPATASRRMELMGRDCSLPRVKGTTQ